MNACSEMGKETNPFLSDYKTPFEVPPFDKVTYEHYMPAFEKGMADHKAEVEAILSSSEEPTFENTIVAMDRSGEVLDRVTSVFFGLSSANTSAELQEIQMKISPELSAHSDAISLDPRFFQKVKAVYDNRDSFDLTTEEAYILENLYKGLVRQGADLPEDKKNELKAYNQELTLLGVKINQNVLKEINGFQMVIEDEEDLAGLPESVKSGAAEAAAAAGMEGKWLFTTQKPSMLPFLTYAHNRELRRKLYDGYLMRGDNNNENDNKELLASMMEIRAKRAELLGYPTHAHLVLESRMAKEPQNVYDLLDQLWAGALPAAKRDLIEMQAIADREGADFKIESSDWWYYAEKLRKEKYDLDDNELRPYFKLENVMNGAFAVATNLYGITFTELKDIPKPHSEAVAFEVKEENGDHLGVLYLDFHPRESKRQGAWCGRYRSHKVEDGKEITPVVTMVMNFTRGSGNVPSLLSLDEVETLFHEFGHALDGLFAENNYSYSYVARDFVELPSQIMEHWVTLPEVLEIYAKHYETGEVIPDELVTRIRNSSLFNQGFIKTEFLAACYLDMAYHTVSAGTDISVEEFEEEALDKIGLIDEIEPRYRSTYFTHIVGGYDAGYYSYDWSAVLDHDAFEAFKENGIFDRNTADRFRTNILAKNGTMDPMEMYVAFRGQEPSIEPLLRNLGFLD